MITELDYRKQLKKNRNIPSFVVIIFCFSLILFIAQSISIDVVGIPVQILLILSLLCWFIVFRLELLIGSLKLYSPIQLISVCLIAIPIFIHSLITRDYSVFGQLVIGFVIACLSIQIFNNKPNRNILLYSVSIMVILSSIMAILQFLDLSPYLWAHTKYANIGYYTYGSTGFENSPVSFIYSSLGIVTIILASLVFSWRNRIKLLPYSYYSLHIISIITILGYFSSNSRAGIMSLLISVFIGLFLVEIFNKFKPPTLKVIMNDYKVNKYWIMVLWWLFIIIGVCIFIYVIGIHNVSAFDDPRALFKNWSDFIPIIYRRPFGLITDANLVNINNDYYFPYYGNIMSEINIFKPHNLFLTTGIYYGIPAALGLLFLYLSIFINGLKAIKRAFYRGNIVDGYWIISLFIANLAIFVYSWFHNASIAMGEMRNWLWLGLIIWESRSILCEDSIKGSERWM